MKFISTLADRLFERLSPRLTEILAHKEEECYSIAREMAKSKDLSLSKDEKLLLQKLANDAQFISIIDKLIFSVSVTSINCTTEQQLAEKRGGVRALEVLKTEATNVGTKKKKNNPLTGEIIT